MRCRTLALALAVAIAIATSGCNRSRRGHGAGDDDDDLGDGDADTDADSDADSDADGDGDAGWCASECVTVEDCCGGIPCPENNAFVCRSNRCDLVCASDDDCTFGGLVSGYTCHPYGGRRTCMTACTDSGTCEELGIGACDGRAEDGTSFCRGICSTDEECSGYGVCEGGHCGCHGDQDCDVEGTACSLQ